jgi:hypothetical protein
MFGGLQNGSLFSSLNKPKVTKVKGGVVALDSYNQQAYNLFKNRLSHGSVKFYDKDNFYISYLKMNDITTGNIEISNAIASEDLDDIIEVRAFDELGLDIAVDYIFKYVETEMSSSGNRVFNVFAIPRSSVDSLFDELKDINHIDYITPAPLFFGVLYKKDYLRRGNCDCFLYLDSNDAHISIYYDGKYIFSKSILYSLKKLQKEFEELTKSSIDEDSFFKLLNSEGLNSSDQEIKKSIMKVFGDMFSLIGDLLDFAKRTNSLTSIDSIYIGSSIGEIYGLPEFASSYLGLSGFALRPKVAANSTEINIDPMLETIFLFARDYISEKDDSLNTSLFLKPPPIFSRPSGQLIKTGLISLSICLAYPSYQMVMTYMLKEEYNNLSNQHRSLSTGSENLKTRLLSAMKVKEELTKKLAMKNRELQYRTGILNKIYQKKVSYPMKASLLNTLFKKVNRYNSKVIDFNSVGTKVMMTVKSKRGRDITELIKDLSKDRSYRVSTDLITKKSGSSFYISTIKVVVDENI